MSEEPKEIDIELTMCDHVGGDPLSEELIVAAEFCRIFPHLSGSPLDVNRQVSLLEKGKKGKIFFLREMHAHD